MAKRIVSSSVPIHKVKPMKHGKRKKFLLKRVLDYLKSDNYMCAPLLSFKNLGFCSAPMVSASSPGVNVSEPILVKKKNLLGKVKDYMISDQYLYAPLVDYQPLLPAAISTSSSQDKGKTRMM
ncbi:hypothetical protein M9H77_06542 [Catharanthus roseus]|uniref:Uncharacterized protein n=1 Tax=Catharanthus roseus TaxID=4058 RepID=A0ACC0BSD8_CATRO|nr:hypothetical protein M9H77_06542 [Catharanthus roseus]